MNFELYNQVIAFLFGSVIGSFSNVCIFRLPKDLSIVSPRSSCTRCGNGVAWYDNIPLLSYVILKGRCRHCGIPFGVTYPLVELAVGLCAWWFYRSQGVSIASVYFFILTTALIIVSVIDLNHKIIPNVISIPGIWIGLGMACVAAWLGIDWPVTIQESVLGILIGGGILWGVGTFYEKIMGREGIGFGDVKLLALFGANVGVFGVLTSLIYGSLLGSIIGLGMMLFFGKNRKYAIPFGPFLCLGLWIHAAYGEEAINIPMRFIAKLFG